MDRLGRALAAEDAEALVATMADDVTLRVAVHDTPFEGNQAAGQIFGVVLGGVLREIEVLDTIVGDGATAALIFSAAGHPGAAEGAFVVRSGEDGRIADLTVFLRPLAALRALEREMGRLMGGPRPGGLG